MLWLASARFLGQRPWQVGAALAGIVLGVAVVVAVDLANSSASRGFELAQRALTGRATHQIVGGPSGVPESLYVALRTELGLVASAPVIEGEAFVAGSNRLHVLGIDPFAEAGMRALLEPRQGQPPPTALLVPGTAMLLAEDAARLGVGRGDTLLVRAAGDQQPLTVAGLIMAPEPARQGLHNRLLVDIATAQVLLDRVGELDRIDLTLAADTAADWRRRLRARLPPAAQLVEAEQETVALQRMSAAFQLNLTAFSLLALLVGAFLIYNSMAFSVVQRRSLIGMLRALGAVRGQVFRLILVEALALGALGTLGGLALGIGLAELLLGMVTRTIDDLYYALAVRDVALTPGSLLKGAALGIGASVLAALAPAWEATRVAPRAALTRSDLEAGVNRLAPRLGVAGVAMLTAGTVLLVVAGALAAGFAGVFLLLMGAALLAPLAIRAMAAVLAWCHGAAARLLERLAPGLTQGSFHGEIARMAVRSAPAHLSRSAVAVAALMVAVSAVIGVGVMVDSFRHTFAGWLDATLRADFVVSHEGGSVPAAVQARVRAMPAVAAVGGSRFADVRMDEERVRLRAVDLASLALGAGPAGAYPVQTGDLEAQWPALLAGSAVMITEPLANRRRLAVGDEVALATASGRRRFPVAAVVYDYTSSSGAIIMERAAYRALWRDDTIDRLAVQLVAGANATQVARQLGGLGHDGMRLQVRSQAELRAYALRIFDRTFAVTRVLQWLAMVVAAIGVLSALLAMMLERTREYAVLRALGLTPGQLVSLVIAQSGLLGLMAGLLAIPLGLALAAALTLVINHRAFGWTLQFAVDPWIVGKALLLAIVAGLAAGAYPAWRMRGQTTAAALREP